MGISSSLGPGPDGGNESGRGILDDYLLGAGLGQGSIGFVHALKCKRTKQELAVKMIDPVEMPKKDIESEVGIMWELTTSGDDFNCIVDMHDVYYERFFVCLVMDLCKGGDLSHGLARHWEKHGELGIPAVRSLTKQMVFAVKWMHDRNIVHRDVKSDNFLMDRTDAEHPECRLHLADFGCASRLKPGEVLTQKVGTKQYWAPEVWKARYGKPVDVWAVGVVFYGMLHKVFPFKTEEETRTKKLNVSKRVSTDGVAFVRNTLARSKDERWACQAALEHPFLSSITSATEKAEARAKELERAARAAEEAARRAKLEARGAAIKPIRKKREAEGLKCAQGHPLKPVFTDTSYWICDSCGRVVPKGEQMYGCRECDWDLCHACPAPQSEIGVELTQGTESSNSAQVSAAVPEAVPNFNKSGTMATEVVKEATLDSNGEAIAIEGDDFVPEMDVCPFVKERRVRMLKRLEAMHGGTGSIIRGPMPVANELFLQEHFDVAKDATCKLGHKLDTHGLSYVKMDMGGHCDTCHRDIALGEPIARCHRCRWDLCETCKDAHRATVHFEWWTPAEVQAAGLAHVPAVQSSLPMLDTSGHAEIVSATSKRDLSAEGMEATPAEIVNILRRHTDLAKFGTEAFKNVTDFVEEVVTGQTQVLIDATSSTVVRAVDIVQVRIVFGKDDNKRFLVRTAEKFPDGRERTNINQLCGIRKLPYENAMQAASRLLRERLHMEMCRVKIDPDTREYFEEKATQTSFPGVQTVYRKEIFEATIASSSQEAMQAIGLTTRHGTYRDQDEDGFERSYRWLRQSDCENLRVQLHAPQTKANSVSCLCVAQLGYPLDELLERFQVESQLESSSTVQLSPIAQARDVSRLGVNGVQAFEDFVDEFTQGEAQLVKRNDQYYRCVDIVSLRIRNKLNFLVEASERGPGGDKEKMRLPCVRRRPDENLFHAAKRVLSEVICISENLVIIDPDSCERSQEEHSYDAGGNAPIFNVPTIYRKYVIAAAVVEDTFVGWGDVGWHVVDL